MKLSVENEQLRSGAAVSTNAGNHASATKISYLENKLLAKQEELTELHKHKGENSQMIIDLGLKLEKQNLLLNEKDARFVNGHFLILICIGNSGNEIKTKLQNVYRIITKYILAISPCTSIRRIETMAK